MLKPLAVLTGLAVTLAAAEPMAALEFDSVLPVAYDEDVWQGGLSPAEGPPREGRPTVALRWDVSKVPGPNSPPLLSTWENVAAVRFWLWIDSPKSYRCNVLLTGKREYFNSSIPLDFSGWKEITVRIDQMTPVRGARLQDMRQLSFRMQGYGQPELPARMVWWLDDIRVAPQPGTRLKAANSMEENRDIWITLAQQGNPILEMLESEYAEPVGDFEPPREITSAWQYRSAAQKLAPIAWLAGAPDSPFRARADLVRHTVQGIDWLVEACRPEGWWWRKNPPTGDPNVNRFVLGPLLDAILWIRTQPDGTQGWDRWKTRLDAAIELQRRAYHGQESWDWGGRAAGEYANQDLYYVLNMAQSARLYDRPADQAEAEDMLRRVADNLLPDGGIHYIGITNEAPVYHGLNLILIARYLTLSADAAAAKLLADTRDYWPLVLTAEGQPEFWSDVWWKQTWGGVSIPGMIIAAGGTDDPRNHWLMWRVLERRQVDVKDWSYLCAMPFWPDSATGLRPMPETFLVGDGNMRGLRGRAGNWYYGVARGRGLRNTFVGGLITDPESFSPLQAAFRGAQIDVLPEQVPWRGYGLWLSQIEDDAALARDDEMGAAIGVRYFLQPGKINGWPTPETPASPWRVTQVWHASPKGHIGLVHLEAEAGAEGAAVAGRIALGPAACREINPGEWACGPIGVRFYEHFGELSSGPTPHYTRKPDRAWHGVIAKQPLTESPAGKKFTYLVWVGPREQEAPENVQRVADNLGWVARWSDGDQLAVLFNPDSRPRRVYLPWEGPTPAAYVTGAGEKLSGLTRDGDGLTAQPPANSCMIIKGR